MARSFYQLFPKGKALIGMLHLAGDSPQKVIDLAVSELEIYEESGFDGVIVEDYFGTSDDVRNVLNELSNYDYSLVIGVNILRDSEKSFKFGQRYADFIQVDSMHPADTPFRKYNSLRNRFSDVPVFGGINFKYQTQERGEGLERELKRAIPRCEAIVTTGRGTGKETKLENIINIKTIIKNNCPLIIGAGINKDNIAAQLSIADGAIIGSYIKGCGSYFGESLKPHHTVDMEYAKELSFIRDGLIV